jgi:hypothetical protein
VAVHGHRLFAERHAVIQYCDYQPKTPPPGAAKIIEI